MNRQHRNTEKDNQQNRNILLLFLGLNLILHLMPVFAENGILLNWYSTDDAFYYFKTAQNIGEGKGITFDGISPTNGFHPLWMIVCVPIFLLARMDLYLPLRILIILQAILNAFTGYFLYRLFADSGKKGIGWLAAFFWMFYPPIHGTTSKLGLETGINAFSLTLFIFVISRERRSNNFYFGNWNGITKIGLTSLLVLFSRLDNIFILICFGFWLVFFESQLRWMAQVDFILIFFSAILSYFMRIQQTDNIINFLPFFYLMIGLALIVKPIFLYFLGLYDFNTQKTVFFYILRSFLVAVITGILSGGFFLLIHDILHLFMGYSRSVLLLDMVFTFAWVLISRLMYFFLCQRNKIEGTDLPPGGTISFWIKRALAYFIPLLGGLGLYMLANELYAGVYMPVSGQIKRWWGKMPNSVYGQPNRTLGEVLTGVVNNDPEEGPFWLVNKPMQTIVQTLSRWGENLGLDQDYLSILLPWIFWIGILFVIFFVLMKNRNSFTKLSRDLALLPLFAGVIFHLLSYKTTGYLHTKIWYWIGELIFLVLFFGTLIALAFEKRVLSGFAKSSLMVVLVLICSFSVINLGLGFYQDFSIAGSARELYTVQEDRDFILSKTDNNDIIGMTGGGLTAYFVPERTIINLDGLINSADYFQDLKDNRVNEYLDKIGVKFIYGEEAVLLDSDPYRWTFTDHLTYKAMGPYFALYEYCPSSCN